MKKIIIALGVFLYVVFAGVSPAAEYYGRELCGYPQFSCIKVNKGDTWQKLFPNTYDRELVKRLNRTNVALSYRSWIVVPVNLHKVNYRNLAPFPLSVDPMGEKMIVINLGVQAFGAYDESGKLIHWGPVSGGQDWCGDVGRPCGTATGTFRIIEKKGPECISNTFPIETYGGANMPYCMYYFKGFALHGSDLPGFHASHGCIRLFREDAIWLNQSFSNVGTRVIVMK